MIPIRFLFIQVKLDVIEVGPGNDGAEWKSLDIDQVGKIRLRPIGYTDHSSMSSDSTTLASFD